MPGQRRCVLHIGFYFRSGVTLSKGGEPIEIVVRRAVRTVGALSQVGHVLPREARHKGRMRQHATLWEGSPRAQDGRERG